MIETEAIEDFLSFHVYGCILCRVEIRRGGRRNRGVAVVRQLSLYAGVSVRSIAPFPDPAHQTGRAIFPHPAFRLASPLGSRLGGI